MIDFSKVTRNWRSKSFLSGVLLFLFASFAFLARIPVQAQDQGPGTIRKEVNLVVLDATVKKKDGQIMGSLKKKISRFARMASRKQSSFSAVTNCRSMLRWCWT